MEAQVKFKRRCRKKKGRNISIFLHSVNSSKDFDHHKKVKANCSFSLKDQVNGGCNKLSYCKWFSTTTPSWGYPGFMPLTQLHDRKKGYLVNDCILVEVELKIMFEHRVKSFLI